MQCQAEVTFDREVEGCLAPQLKWRERTGRGWRGLAEIEFQQDSIPKKFQDRQREAARDRTGSWMFSEQTTGRAVCVRPGQGV